MCAGDQAGTDALMGTAGFTIFLPFADRNAGDFIFRVF
jgi:hypothetical protein